MSRPAGRTFRHILESLHLASLGCDVVYYCPSNNMAKYAFDKAYKMTKVFILQPETERFLLKIGNGSIRFKGYSSGDELNYDKRHYKLIFDR